MSEKLKSKVVIRESFTLKHGGWLPMGDKKEYVLLSDALTELAEKEAEVEKWQNEVDGQAGIHIESLNQADAEIATLERDNNRLKRSKYSWKHKYKKLHRKYRNRGATIYKLNQKLKEATELSEATRYVNVNLNQSLTAENAKLKEALDGMVKAYEYFIESERADSTDPDTGEIDESVEQHYCDSRNELESAYIKGLDLLNGIDTTALAECESANSEPTASEMLEALDGAPPIRPKNIRKLKMKIYDDANSEKGGK